MGLILSSSRWATEIALGIVCMGVVSRLIFPSELAPKLIALANQLFDHVDNFAALAMDPAAGREQLISEREALAKDLGAVETIRSSLFFESAEAHLTMDRSLRDAMHAAVDVCAIVEAVAAGLSRCHSMSEKRRASGIVTPLRRRFATCPSRQSEARGAFGPM